MDYRTSYERWQRQKGNAEVPRCAADWRNYRGPGAALVLKSKPKIHFEPTPRDILVQCPKCKTVETLQFVGATLTPSRKFRQEGGRIYHDCGSEQPCRLRG